LAAFIIERGTGPIGTKRGGPDSFVGASMSDWPVRHITVFGVPTQNWMLLVLAILLIGIAAALWLQR
jgi:hypothetical protein